MSDSFSRAWLITNHAPLQIVLQYTSIASDDLIIAVDGGFKRCLELNLSPQVLIGDFDSIEPVLLAKLPSNCQKITYPSEKNETDTQLALQLCIDKNISEVIVCNDLSGRFDHSLALMQNLLQAHQAGLKASVVSENQIVTILDDKVNLSYPLNSLLSLISISDKAEFLFSSGLKYPLANLILYNWQSRGISNIVTEPVQQIFLASGIVLAVITPSVVPVQAGTQPV